jgi:hypothetical protein
MRDKPMEMAPDFATLIRVTLASLILATSLFRPGLFHPIAQTHEKTRGDGNGQCGAYEVEC